MYRPVPGVHQDLDLPDVSCREDITELSAATAPQTLYSQTGNTLASTPGACARRVVDTPVRSGHAPALNLGRYLLLLNVKDIRKRPLECIRLMPSS